MSFFFLVSDIYTERLIQTLEEFYDILGQEGAELSPGAKLEIIKELHEKIDNRLNEQFDYFEVFKLTKFSKSYFNE